MYNIVITRHFVFIICLFGTSFSFGLFFFTIHLFLLAKWLPLCNYARYIGQNLEQSIKSAEMSSLMLHHYHLWVLRQHFPELTLLSVSRYCCTNSSIMSSVYTSELCHSDLSKRYSIFLLALFKMKFIMDRVVSCTAVLASCQIQEEIFWRYMTKRCTFSVCCCTAATALMNVFYESQSLTLRPCVKKALLQTGGRDITIIMESRRGRGMTSRVWKTVDISGWAS